MASPFEGMDPDTMLRQLREQAEALETRATQLRTELDSATASATSPDGAVRTAPTTTKDPGTRPGCALDGERHAGRLMTDPIPIPTPLVTRAKNLVMLSAAAPFVMFLAAVFAMAPRYDPLDSYRAIAIITSGIVIATVSSMHWTVRNIPTGWQPGSFFAGGAVTFCFLAKA